MNAPDLTDLRSYTVRDPADEKMEQVRELLVGDAVRRLEVRIAMLEHRLAEVEVGMGRQLDALEARILELAGNAEGDRRSAFEALARSIADLGEQVHRISRG